MTLRSLATRPQPGDHLDMNHMNRNLGHAVLVVFGWVGSTMAIMNPSQGDYANFVFKHMMNDTKQAVCPQESDTTQSTLTSLIQEFCNGMVVGLGTYTYEEALRVIDLKTTSTNYIVCSIYQTEVFGKSYRALGIYGRFLQL
ncbi:DUF4359 domain-containing protein [Leptolyngbya sp. AN02str]|uniref:DUF4359 domain-containing protein n=1 Tax=Leptolyngbya sp. AN02str TaxID=3423363 RepID=UPI003D32206A